MSARTLHLPRVMRYAAVGVLVAASFGIHCSAPTDQSTDTSVPEVAAPAPPSRERPAQAPAESAVAPSRSELEVPALAALVHAGIAPQVTSTVRDDAGSVYVTGTFFGEVIIGNTTLTSKGDTDVFLLKLDSTGGFGWVRAVGSATVERAPRVTLSIASDRITLVGLTDGDMDCGAGPMAPWSSGTFFLCIFGGTDGTSVSSGVFPTGSP